MSQPTQYASQVSVIGLPTEWRPPQPSSTAPDCGEVAPGIACALRAMLQPGHHALSLSGGLAAPCTPPQPSSVYTPLNGCEAVAVADTAVDPIDHALTTPEVARARALYSYV